MNKKEIKEMLKDIKLSEMELIESIVDPDYEYYSYYLGSYMNLDPCGRYHHVFSPNNITEKCEDFWENLEFAAEDIGGWIESGESDPTDIFYCLPNEVKK